MAAFGFSVLPPAKTYQRIWQATRQPVMVAYWMQTIREAICVDEGYLCAMEKLKTHVLKSETFTFEIPFRIIENFSTED